MKVNVNEVIDRVGCRGEYVGRQYIALPISVGAWLMAWQHVEYLHVVIFSVTHTIFKQPLLFKNCVCNISIQV